MKWWVSRPRRAATGSTARSRGALDVLGERWSLLILRDMLVGTSRFNDLARGLPGLSRSLLTKRLRQFERGRTGRASRRGVRRSADAGRDLEPIVFGLGAWGARWTFGEPAPDELDPELLVWSMHTRLDTSELPGTPHRAPHPVHRRRPTLLDRDRRR